MNTCPLIPQSNCWVFLNTLNNIHLHLMIPFETSPSICTQCPQGCQIFSLFLVPRTTERSVQNTEGEGLPGGAAALTIQYTTAVQLARLSRAGQQVALWSSPARLSCGLVMWRKKSAVSFCLVRSGTLRRSFTLEWGRSTVPSYTKFTSQVFSNITCLFVNPPERVYFF